MEVRLPLSLWVALVLVDGDLESVNAEPLAVRFGQPFQVLHGGFGLDYYHRFTYWGGFRLHFLASRFEVSRLDGFKANRLRVVLPILVLVGKLGADVVELLFPLVVLFTSTFDGLDVDGGLLCHDALMVWSVAVGWGGQGAVAPALGEPTTLQGL